MKILTQSLKENREEIKHQILEFIRSPDFNIEFGQNWYYFASSQLMNEVHFRMQSNRINFEPSEIYLIASILSPANRWDKNVEDTINFIDWFNTDFREESKPKFKTYGSNVKKCIKLVSARYECKLLLNWYQGQLGRWILENMKAKKTYNFYRNLLSPKDNKFFTIDRHMLKIAGIESLVVTPLQYELLKKIYLELFEDNKHIFKNSSNFQSVLWANYVYQKQGILHY